MRSRYQIAGIALAAACAVCGQEQRALSKPGPMRHQFGLDVPVWFGATASFSGGMDRDAGIITGDPSVDSRADRFYDDGYVRVNALGNPTIPGTGPADTFPRTSYFGFQSNQQVTEPDFSGATIVPGSVSYHNVRLNGGTFEKGFSNDPTPGMELFYRYTAREEASWSWGLEAGLSWMRLDWDQTGTFGAVATVQEDRYNTGTVNAKVSVSSGGLPYEGTYDPQPGRPWIGSSPDRQTPYTRAASVTTQREVTSDWVLLRLAPGIDWKASDRISLGLQAGPVVGWTGTDYQFSDRVTVFDPGIPTLNQAGSGSDDRFIFGLYSGLRLAYRISEHWGTHIEARHLWVDDLHVSGGGRNVTVGIADGWGVTAGVSWRF